MASRSEASDYFPTMLILVVILLFAPMGIVFYFFNEPDSWYSAVLAMLWYSTIENFGIFFSPNAAILVALPISSMKIVYVLMIWRAYQGKTTTSRAIRFGIAMELTFPFLYYLPYMVSLFFVPMFFMGWPLAIPLPILLLGGWLAFRLHPPTEISDSWVDTEQHEEWWQGPPNQDPENGSN